MNHTDAHGSGEHRRHVEGRRLDLTPIGQTLPALSRGDSRSLAMYGLMHEELARQRQREACLEARRARLRRAVRAQRRARRAAEVAVRAAERAAGVVLAEA
jgi:hypothetical protein